ncbi:MAG: YdeI/OmpD-associated family protein [Pyrinomonadaceae bacterium]
MAKPVKFKTELTRSMEGSGWHYLIVGPEIPKKLKFEGKLRRVVCSINGGEDFQCALMPWGGQFFIIVNQQKRDALGIVVGDTVSVELVRDESKYGLPMPEELREVLDQDPKGDKLFHSLTAGKQRSMLYFIGQIKNIDKRIYACLILIEHLKTNDGKVVNDKLQEEWKIPIY